MQFYLEFNKTQKFVGVSKIYHFKIHLQKTTNAGVKWWILCKFNLLEAFQKHTKKRCEAKSRK